MDSKVYDIIEEMVDVVAGEIVNNNLPVETYGYLSELFGVIPEQDREQAFRNFLIGLDIAGIEYDKSQFQGV